MSSVACALHHSEPVLARCPTTRWAGRAMDDQWTMIQAVEFALAQS